MNIVAGGTCWTCLLSHLQMVGNVPDLLTPPGASAAGAPQPMQPIPLTPLCVHCVYECAFVPVCVYKLPHGHLSFPLTRPIFQFRHTQSSTCIAANLPPIHKKTPNPNVLHEPHGIAPFLLLGIRQFSFSQFSPLFHKLFMVTLHHHCTSAAGGDKSHHHLV